MPRLAPVISVVAIDPPACFGAQAERPAHPVKPVYRFATQAMLSRSRLINKTTSAPVRLASGSSRRARSRHRIIPCIISYRTLRSGPPAPRRGGIRLSPAPGLRGGALTEIVFIVLVAASLLLALPTTLVPLAAQ